MNFMVALEENLGGSQSQQDSSSGKHTCTKFNGNSSSGYRNISVWMLKLLKGMKKYMKDNLCIL